MHSIKPSYWFDKKKVEDSAQEKKPQTLEHGFEKDPSGLNVSISIENLSKVISPKLNYDIKNDLYYKCLSFV